MHFSKSLYPSFFIWQIFSLSPFALTQKKFSQRRVHRALSCTLILIQIIVFIHGLIVTDYYVNPSLPLVTKYTVVSLISLLRLTAIVVTVESWLKRSMQIEFLNKIEQIDEIFAKKFDIDLKHQSHRQWNFIVLLIQLSLYIFSTVAIPFIDVHMLFILHSIILVPSFMNGMCYNQAVLYGKLIVDRCQALNNFVERLHLYESGELPHIETSVISKLVDQVQKSHQKFIELSEIYFELFQWSMLFNIANDFQIALVSSFWFIGDIITGTNPLHYLPSIAYSIICSLNVTIMSHINSCINIEVI